MSLPTFVSSPNPTIYLTGRFLTVDFETTNIEKGTALEPKNNLLLACWRIDGRNKSTWGGEFEQQELLADIASVDFIVAHNTKFELGWLKRIGLDLRTVLPFDTMIGEKTIAGNRKVELSLQATATRRGLGTKDATSASLIKSGVCPSQIPARMLEDYCRQDVLLTEAVFKIQRQELSDLGLLPVAYCRNLVTPVLADIEFNGMCLDPKRVAETYEIYSQQYTSLAQELHVLTGGINFRSSKQMRDYIYNVLKFAPVKDYRGNDVTTDGGELKTDKATISGLKAVTPEQKEFKRVAGKLATLKVPMQNLTKMQAICEANPDDPRVFATYNQTVTQTDRLSSTGRNGGFQFHNFDRAFKRLFRARQSGFVICEADAPQLEFRVAAFLGHDDRAKLDILEGMDVHAATAATLGVKRQDAKAFTFKPLYGGNSGTPRQLEYYDYFRKRYSGLYRTQQSWTMAAARDKFLVTPWGLRFYWPDAEIKKSGYVTGTTQIFNYPIQSFATADIIPLTLVLLWHSIGDFGDSAVITNTIHDSIICEVSLECLDRLVHRLIDSFTLNVYRLLQGIYGIRFTVPLGVAVKSGTFWSEGEEQKFEPGSGVLPSLQADCSPLSGSLGTASECVLEEES